MAEISPGAGMTLLSACVRFTEIAAAAGIALLSAAGRFTEIATTGGTSPLRCRGMSYLWRRRNGMPAAEAASRWACETVVEPVPGSGAEHAAQEA